MVSKMVFDNVNNDIMVVTTNKRTKLFSFTDNIDVIADILERIVPVEFEYISDPYWDAIVYVRDFKDKQAKKAREDNAFNIYREDLKEVTERYWEDVYKLVKNDLVPLKKIILTLSCLKTLKNQGSKT